MVIFFTNYIANRVKRKHTQGQVNDHGYESPKKILFFYKKRVEIFISTHSSSFFFACNEVLTSFAIFIIASISDGVQSASNCAYSV